MFLIGKKLNTLYKIQNNTRGKTETVLYGAENTKTGNTQRTWLPKYGSQSETMINNLGNLHKHLE